MEFVIKSFGFLLRRRKADFPFFRFTCNLLLLAQFLTAETALLAFGLILLELTGHLLTQKHIFLSVIFC
jgi:hypothetical protein